MKFFWSCGKYLKINVSFFEIINYFFDFVLERDPFWKEISNLSYEKIFEILIKDANFTKKSFVEGLFTIFDYKNKKVQKLIWQMKYKENKTIADFFGWCLAEKISREFPKILEKYFGLILNNDGLANILLIPVPIHKKRRAERGYNQCEWVSEAIIKKLHKDGGVCANLIYNPKILVKKKYTVKQSWINRGDRLKNVRESFAVLNGPILKNSLVILIDDVCTTGATLNEARRTLLASGAKSVYFFTIAH